MKGIIIMILLATLVMVNSSSYKECSPSQKVCEYWFNVHEMLTMHWRQKVLKASNGTLYPVNESPTNITTKVPIDEVISVDGFNRLVTVVNNSIPGPPIIVYEGQQVIVHVKNSLMIRTTTIHWHGLHLIGNPWMDGVPYVSQCPISPGRTFTYKFKAYPKGTFYWHSHVAAQRIDGVFGAIIIKPRLSPNAIEEHIMHVGDWWHESSTELHYRLQLSYYKQQPNWKPPVMLDGVGFPPVKFYSAIIEGRGRYRDPTTGIWNETPLKEFHVQRGKEHRFRMIAAGVLFPFRVSIDNHPLTVVATDGFDVHPRIFESIIISPGERFDFIITANQSVGNYWIRVDSLENVNHYARGILRYDNTSTDEPTTSRMACTPNKQCSVLNCMFSYYPNATNTPCVLVDQLNSTKEDTPAFEADSEELFFNSIGSFATKDGFNMHINGKVHHNSYSSLFANNDAKRSCNRTQCTNNADRVCHCFHEKILPFNKTIQMVLSVFSHQGQENHPMHLHGHNFHLLKLGYSVQNETTGLRTGNNEELDCVDTQCYQTKWKDTLRRGDNITGMNKRNPPRKDTVMIPAGGYAIIRFRSDNPGKWMLHCHLNLDQMIGMSMILNEAPERQPARPGGMPVCNNFFNDPRLDEKPKVNGSWGNWSIFGKCTVACGGGLQSRSRSCNNPPAANGGLECMLSYKDGKRGTLENEAVICNNIKCPDDWSFNGVKDIIHLLFFLLLVIFILESVFFIAYYRRNKRE